MVIDIKPGALLHGVNAEGLPIERKIERILSKGLQISAILHAEGIPEVQASHSWVSFSMIPKFGSRYYLPNALSRSVAWKEHASEDGLLLILKDGFVAENAANFKAFGDQFLLYAESYGADAGAAAVVVKRFFEMITVGEDSFYDKFSADYFKIYDYDIAALPFESRPNLFEMFPELADLKFYGGISFVEKTLDNWRPDEVVSFTDVPASALSAIIPATHKGYEAACNAVEDSGLSIQVMPAGYLS